jgi:hypothetical protein
MANKFSNTLDDSYMLQKGAQVQTNSILPSPPISINIYKRQILQGMKKILVVE